MGGLEMIFSNKCGAFHTFLGSFYLPENPLICLGSSFAVPHTTPYTAGRVENTTSMSLSIVTVRHHVGRLCVGPERRQGLLAYVHGRLRRERETEGLFNIV